MCDVSNAERVECVRAERGHWLERQIRDDVSVMCDYRANSNTTILEACQMDAMPAQGFFHE